MNKKVVLVVRRLLTLMLMVIITISCDKSEPATEDDIISVLSRKLVYIDEMSNLEGSKTLVGPGVYDYIIHFSLPDTLSAENWMSFIVGKVAEKEKLISSEYIRVTQYHYTTETYPSRSNEEIFKYIVEEGRYQLEARTAIML